LTAADLNKFSDTELHGILGSFALKLQPEALIPQSFVRQYGESAASEFALAAERAAASRGKPEMYATATLDGGIGGKADKNVNSDVPASLTVADHSVHQTTAPKKSSILPLLELRLR